MARRPDWGQRLDIDVMRLFAAVWKKLLAVFSLILIVSVVVVVVSGALTPQYLGESRILIQCREQVYPGMLSRRPAGLDAHSVDSQVKVIQSTDLIRAVAAELNLDREPEYGLAARSSVPTSLANRLGLDAGRGDAPSEERLIHAFRRHLSVSQVNNSQLVKISFWSTDKRLAEQVPNTIAATYLTMLNGTEPARKTDATPRRADPSLIHTDEKPNFKALRLRLRDMDSQIRNAAPAGHPEAPEVESVRADIAALEKYAPESEVMTPWRPEGAADPLPDHENPMVDARLITRATTPTVPHFPKLSIIVACALGTLLLSTIIIMVQTLLFGGRIQSADAETSERPAARLPRGTEPVSALEVPKDALRSVDQTERLHAADQSAAIADKVVRFGEAENENAKPEDGHSLARQTRHGIRAIANHLISRQTRIAVVVSPQEDRASASSVMLARMLAHDGCQTLLLDMTGSTFPTRMMASRADLLGITDLLGGGCLVSDTLHSDRLSRAHILPHGTMEPAAAMAHAVELPRLIEAVSEVHDIVIVECGSASSNGVRRLVADRDGVEMIVSLIRPDEQLITEFLTEFTSEGFEDPLIMSPDVGNGFRFRRRAA